MGDDDILFLVLVALVFFIGISFYKFESFENTPEGELYQTQGIKDTILLLDTAVKNVRGTLSSMVSSLTGEIQGKINTAKNYIEDCVDEKEFSGTLYYPGTCYKWQCGPKYICGSSGCPFNCKAKWCDGPCADVPYPCTKEKTHSVNLPYWSCSVLPKGFSQPVNPFPMWQ